MIDIRLPKLGEGADSGTVVSIQVAVSDRVTKGQTLIELENEKAVASIPATASGTVTTIHVKQGDKISVGHLLVSLDAEAGARAPAEDGTRRATREAAPAGRVPRGAPEPLLEEDLEPEGEPAAGGLPPAASPSIRKMARELGIDLRTVRGSERGGRITPEDLRAYVQRLKARAARGSAAPAAPAPERIDFSKWGPVTRQPFTPLRHAIAKRMADAWATIPHVTQFDDADITGLLELKKQYDEAYEKRGARLTLTAFLLKVLAAQLKVHWKLNTSLDEVSQELVQKHYCHLGIAVDTEAGLIVPVIRDVDKKPLVALSKELNLLAEKTRQRKVTAEDLQGSTFTVSNQGGIGGGHFTPIIRKPDVAILGVGKGARKPVVRDGAVEVRMLLPLALSYDHRVIDGADAARFIVDLVKGIEEFPERDVKL
jgi:pyruvate dehydrogenase E2 component (dihydrolipoamide acetyltransferase)